MAKRTKKVTVRVTRGRELSAAEVDRVAGGDVTVNKAKTQDKMLTNWDGYIRG
jgi:hypothetical protein